LYNFKNFIFQERVRCQEGHAGGQPPLRFLHL
jgi:hypothetical protein